MNNEGYIKTKFIITDSDLKNVNKVFVSFEYPFDFSNYKNTSNNENNFKNNIYSKLSNTNNLAFDISIGAN